MNADLLIGSRLHAPPDHNKVHVQRFIEGV